MNQALKPFRLEEYLAEREFTSRYMFCASDTESRTIGDILRLLPEQEREEFHKLSLAYTTPEGSPELRKEISRIYSNTDPDHILCLAGAEEGIYAAARAFLSQGDHAVCVTPCYQSLQSVAESVCEVTTVALTTFEGEWQLNPEKVAAAIRPHTKVLFLNFPNNPTGFIPDSETFAEIIEIARTHGIIVFSDEVYRLTELKPEDRIPAAAELYENAVSLGVMSKSLGFPGLRVGWVACRNPDLLKKISDYKHYLSICCSAPSEWLSLAILRHKETILAENHRLLLSNHNLLKEYFTSVQSPFEWYQPRGGCIAYPKYLGKFKAMEMADALLKSKGVVILPDWIYGEASGHFRVSFGRKNCQEALQEFQKFFAENPHYADH